ncbi:MAG: hypothetical protein ABIP51_04860 [Bacteroidia bacterium]
MTTTTNQNKTQELVPAEKQKRIDAHKKIATHLETAAKHHNEAAKYHEEDNTEKAAKSATTAHEHLTHANEIEKKEATKDALAIKK